MNISQHITKKTNGGFIGSNLDNIKPHFKILKNRNDIIKQLGTNQLEYEYLDNIYDRAVNKIDKQYKEDYKASFSALDENEKARIFVENIRLQHPHWSDENIIEFFTLPMYKKKKPPRPQKENKHGFLFLINIILDLFS